MSRPFFIVILALLLASPAQAIKTAASFDASWASAALTLSAKSLTQTVTSVEKSLNSQTGVQVDYNVALFDYRTVANLSFTQFMTSNMGEFPISRVGLGAAYYFTRINGQRIILDNDVETKSWGVAPAIELSLGLNKLTIKDPDDQNLDFSASVIDLIPRLLIEIPASSNMLILLRAGYYSTLTISKNQFYDIKLSGLIFNLGIKLTTF